MGTARSGVVQDIKIIATEQIRFATERAAIHKALVALAGRDLGTKVGVWRRHYDARR